MVDKFFAIIVGTFILFSISMSVVSEQTDHVAQENVDIATTKFWTTSAKAAICPKECTKTLLKSFKLQEIFMTLL